MSNRVQRVTPAFTQGGGMFSPLTLGAAGSIGIRPPAIVGAVEMQTLGFSNDSVNVSVPAIAAGATADVQYTYNPKNLPVNFKLVPGAAGLIYVDIDLPQLPPGLGIIGFAKSLTFGIGASGNPGSTMWTLQANQTYQAPSIQGTIRFFSPAGASATTVTFTAWSFLICRPPVQAP